MVPHFSGRFRLTASLRRRRISMYISLFTVAIPGNIITDQKRLESFEMWCWRRMEKIS